MSPREQIQTDIADWLENQSWATAPYGVICGMQKYAKGKVRTITFGVSRYLDATITVVSPKCLKLAGQGAIAARWGIEWPEEFKSKEELINFLVDKTRDW